MTGDRSGEIDGLARSLRGVPVRTGPRYLLAYGFDATGARGRAGGVAFPGNLDDLARLVREAARRGIAVVPRGAGTGFSGDPCLSTAGS